VVAGRFSSTHSLTTATVATLPQELDFVHYYSQLFTNNSLSDLAKNLNTFTSVLYSLHEKGAYNGSHWWLNYETHPCN